MSVRVRHMIGVVLAGVACGPTVVTEESQPELMLAGTWDVAYERLSGGEYSCVMDRQTVVITHDGGKREYAFYSGSLYNTHVRCSGPGLMLFDYVLATYTGSTARSLALWPDGDSVNVTFEAAQLVDSQRQIGRVVLTTDRGSTGLPDSLTGLLRLTVSLEPYRNIGFAVSGRYVLRRID